MSNLPLNPNIPTIIDPQNYHQMLQESINHFLAQIQVGNYNFTHFNSIFSRLIYAMDSPPIEVIWFYCAVNYHTHKNSTDPHDKMGLILGFKSLFQLLTSLTDSSGSNLKRVSLMAPLVFELYSFVCELNSSGVSSDNMVVEREVVCLVEKLASFISLCCFEGVDDHDDSIAFSSCLVDLVKVWTVGRRGSEFRFEDDFRMFFPGVSDEVCNQLFVGCGVGVLAGVVMFEVLLLSLCLRIGSKEMRMKMEDDVLSCAVDIITGFRSCYFFDTLLKMLLGSSLPVASFLTATHEVQLREVLFDAVVLVNYPFFTPGCRIHLCNLHSNSLALTWLFTADKAMQFARDSGDQTKVLSYMRAFSKSHIKSRLLKWVCNRVGCAEDNGPSFSTPADFVEWLVLLGHKASTGFDGEFATLIDKAMHYKSDMKLKLPFPWADGCNKGFHTDEIMGEDGETHENIEMVDSKDDPNSRCNLDFGAIDGCRKRKGANDDAIIRVKLLKYRSHGSPIKNLSAFQNELGLIRRN